MVELTYKSGAKLITTRLGYYNNDLGKATMLVLGIGSDPFGMPVFDNICATRRRLDMATAAVCDFG